MSLTITTDHMTATTVIPNIFIDKYMKDANDSEIKVYLYLLRMKSAGVPTTLSDMADLFNFSEKDLLRALRYWEKCGLMALEYSDKEQKVLSGIKFLPFDDSLVKENNETPEKQPMGQVTLMVVPTASSKYDESKSYTRDQLRDFRTGEETSQILFVAEQYLKRPLSASDIQALYFIYDELKFTCEMTDYLLQYCLERGKSSFAYIKKVAISWAEQGIITPKQARELTSGKKAVDKAAGTKKKKPSSQGGFGQFEKTDYDFAALEEIMSN